MVAFAIIRLIYVPFNRNHYRVETLGPEFEVVACCGHILEREVLILRKGQFITMERWI